MYLPMTGGATPQVFSLDGVTLDSRYWHHIALTVFQEDAALYVNGSLAAAQSLAGVVRGDSSGDIKLGQIDTRELQDFTISQKK